MATAVTKNQPPLYLVNNREIFPADIVSALSRAGVKSGDVIFVHSDVAVFGKLATMDRDYFFQSLVQVFKDSVGSEGTIIMPTFSYSFSQGYDFDVANTKSAVGALTEYFRTMPGVKRTVDPMLSVAVWGKHQAYLLAVGHDCFGPDSIFEKFHHLKGKLVFFGTRECTFLHYIERMHDVPYRFMKTFTGRIIDGKKAYPDEYHYYARYLDRNAASDYEILEKTLMDKGLIREFDFGYNKILVMPTDLMFEEAHRQLVKNINFLLRDEKSQYKKLLP